MAATERISDTESIIVRAIRWPRDADTPCVHVRSHTAFGGVALKPWSENASGTLWPEKTPWNAWMSDLNDAQRSSEKWERHLPSSVRVHSPGYSSLVSRSRMGSLSISA